MIPISRQKQHAERAFSLLELLVVLVLSSLIVGSIWNFLGKQRKQSVSQRLKADVESMSQISFFIIGRDIRRAGSDPTGILQGADPWKSLEVAEPNRIQIQSDLDGDGVIDVNTDEDITYEFVDDPLNPDGIQDQIRRQAGNNLVIENVRAFDLCYQFGTTGAWDCNPTASNLVFVKTVRMRLVAGTGRINPNTGNEDTKEIQMNIRLRNFQ